VSAVALRRRILDSLDEPDSATGLGRRLGVPRQKVNYHLRELERAGLVELAEERRRRGFVERRVRAVARDRFSSAYLVGLARRLAEDVTTLRERAAAAGQRLATLALETEVRFASPADLRAFSEELANEVARLAAKYDRPDLARSRAHRVVAAAHPTITKED
jgi:DNA-binding transcriptional ArsR family regulator